MGELGSGVCVFLSVIVYSWLWLLYQKCCPVGQMPYLFRMRIFSVFQNARVISGNDFSNNKV